MEKQIITKLEKLDKISRKRWLGSFPSHFPDEIWNGHWEREEKLLKKDLNSLKENNPKEFKSAIQKCDCKKYYMSCNHHNGKVGLDTEMTPQGGGTIAQSDSEENTIRIAFEVYGINDYFIY